MVKYAMKIMDTATPSRRGLWVAIILILAVASLPRLIWPDLGEVLFPDEMRDYHRTTTMLSGKDFPVDGPTRWDHGRGAFPGAMWYYLMAIPYSLSSHPAAGLLFQNILGTLSVLIFFFLGMRMFGFQVALWAGLLYALSPWSILIGRKLWNPHLAPLFAMAFFYFTWRWVDEKKSWPLMAALFTAGILMQIHPIFLPLLLAMPLFAIYLGKPGWRPLPWLAGGIAFALTYLPFLVHEVTHGLPVLQSLFSSSVSREGGGAALEGLKAFLIPFIMTTPELSDYLRKGTLDFDGVWLPVVAVVTLGMIFSQIMALGKVWPPKDFGSKKGVVARAVAHLRDPAVRPYLFVAVFLALFITVNLARMAMAVPRYFIPVYPLLFLLSSAFLFKILSNTSTGWRGAWYRGRFVFLSLALAVGAAFSFQYLYGWQRGITYHNQSKNVVRYYMQGARWAVAQGGGNFIIEGEDAVRWKGEPDPISDLTTLIHDAVGYRPDAQKPLTRIRIWVSDPTRPGLPPAELLQKSAKMAQFANLWLFRLETGSAR